MKFSPNLPFPAGLALILLFTASACRRKRDPAPVAAPPDAPVASATAAKAPATSTAPAAKPAESPSDSLPTAPPDASLRYPVNKELTGAIHLYLTDYRKMPPDFETLVKEKYLKAMPQAPAGKHFALDRNRMQVVLLD